MIRITRRERFSAAHRLAKDEWSLEKNYTVFGKCANPNWHGHNYILHVTVEGEVDMETGYVIDLSELGKIVKEKVIQHVDHKNLNLDVPFFKGVMTSAENIAIKFWEQLEQPISETGARLHCVKIQETENNYVEYFGK
ncbi:6-pyruvoyl trahydropterin synthase family protein [Acidiluteibacter ferrifornacis]|uniref:6-carboxy-5,6,7,8-tetrahydropterin synthase n=1 Tax=Acidiluteibacter ferrifornacis TaxID=2692424 RepID=A0A6N9NLK7_9FLAO|nr:6-carboxytetrahydropterin synthase [Acidiluteibacter ferrifornacis]NBG66361.1 6-carboxytetrahydropterin synthase [Acidiluteibacter ferrifornacis]